MGWSWVWSGCYDINERTSNIKKMSINAEQSIKFVTPFYGKRRISMHHCLKIKAQPVD
jgi:hypothetical protein